ncbi:MAG TPA: STAS domain-containing protein [Nonomuraea sp.]|nr:STAS domain-containing protein [Nonomuraea sp.]
MKGAVARGVAPQRCARPGATRPTGAHVPDLSARFAAPMRLDTEQWPSVRSPVETATTILARLEDVQKETPPMSFEASKKSTLSVTSGLSRNAIIVRLEGELDVNAVPAFREHMERVWELPPQPFLIMDLADVAFCDSMGMNELIGIMQRCEARGTRLLLGGVQGVMARVLSITGLRHAFEVFAKFDDAVRLVVATL